MSDKPTEDAPDCDCPGCREARARRESVEKFLDALGLTVEERRAVVWMSHIILGAITDAARDAERLTGIDHRRMVELIGPALRAARVQYQQATAGARAAKSDGGE